MFGDAGSTPDGDSGYGFGDPYGIFRSECSGEAPEGPPSPLADTLLRRVTTLYPQAADPGRAAGAAAYMKHVAPFLGIPAPQRRALSKRVVAGTAQPDEADCAAVALRGRRLPEREYRGP